MGKISAITTLTLLCVAASFAQQKDSFKDPRDKITYKTVKIGEQTWMAENLSFNGGKCYDNKPANCQKYGMLYDWLTAMDACPAGWHLPSIDEWNVLIRNVDDNPGAKLKASGTNDFGFSALLGGYGEGSKYSGIGNEGYWWTIENAAKMASSYDIVKFGYQSLRDNYYFSVRCLKGNLAGSEKKMANELLAEAKRVAAEKEAAEKERIAAEAVEKVEIEKAAGKQFNPSIKYGSFTDARDKATYKTTKIGELTWMAENLRYKTEGSSCYNGKEYYCKRDGRLYSWAAANKACPAGWHLPVREEWDILEKAIGNNPEQKKLKAKSGWEQNENGTDDFGFSALPTNGEQPAFWNASEEYSYYGMRGIGSAGSTELLSVRCVQGKSPEEAFAVLQKAIENAAGKQFSFVIKYGSFEDTRDDITYKTVKIGEQTWMAENLNYNATGSKCYNDKEYFCKRDGRLYDRATALKACPAGWHLPTDEEWTIMDNVAGGAGTATTGKKLKATRGWLDSTKTKPFNGTDDFGFSALPIGNDNESAWWTASASMFATKATTDGIHRKINNAGIYSRADSPNGNLYSVRCMEGAPKAAAPVAQPKRQSPYEFCQLTFPTKSCVSMPTGSCKTSGGKVVDKCQ